MLRGVGTALLGLTVCVITPVAGAQPPGFDLQAHAGGRGEATGESLRAFAKAIEIGITTIELDVGITQDGQPVVWHDAVIERSACDDTGPVFAGDPAYPYVGKLVHDLTVAQIRTLDCGKPDPQFPAAEVLRGNTIALLSEVFARTGPSGVRYNIETKVETEHPGASAGPQEFVDVVLGAVKAGGVLDRVEIQSFDWRTLPLVHQAEPSIPLVALWNQQSLVGSDPMIGAMTAGADILSPDYRLVDAAFVGRAHALGVRVIPWTVDDADAMRRQIDAGVDGLITNYPTRLRGVLSEVGMPLPPSR